MISSKIVLDSISPEGIRLTTLHLVYPKFIHGEFMTHRVFSRNASSSRAVPVKTMIERIRNDPAMPAKWGSNKPGMQAGEEIAEAELAKNLWIEAAGVACIMAEKMLELNLHKQVINRVTEPFAHINVIVTATEWDNFFALRDHADADPTIQALAIDMKKKFESSKPILRAAGEWHLPYINDGDLVNGIEVCKRISTARCARVSYLNHDGSNPDIVKDLKLYDQLITAKPIHASPTEHQGTPISDMGSFEQWSGNFRGWKQFRKEIESSFL